MKKTLLILGTILLSFVGIAQTTGGLDVTVTTSNAGGQYAPRNCVAIWVEDENGNFVKTLLAYAQMYRTHLNNWESSTTAAGVPFDKTDAISGSTINTHGTRNCNWDGTNHLGTLMNDGTYKLCMELTDKNATGNFSFFTFTKSSIEDSQTPANVPSFSNISFTWNPNLNDIIQHDVSEYSVLPNPTNGYVNINVNQENLKSIKVYNIAGKEILSTSKHSLDISSQPKGMYLFKITTENNIYTKRVIKF